MLDTIVLWLDQIGSEVFWGCVVALVLVDVAAMAVVMQTRSRAIVNRWTGRVLAVNLLLLGAGLGVPAAAFTLKLAASALLPSVSASVAASTTESKAAVPEPALPPAPR